MIEEARRLIESGDFEKAESLLSTAPDSTAASLLGILLMKTGRPNEASDQFELALQRDALNAEALTWLAAARRSQGRLGEAVLLLRRSLNIRENDAEALNLLGACLLSLGRSDEAEEASRSAIGIQSDLASAHSNLGMALRLQNRGEEALASFQQAVELSPEHAPGFLQVFKQLQQLSRWDEAIEALREGLVRHPGSLILSEALALALGRRGQEDEAERIFCRISRVSAIAANSYAKWLQELGRFDDSVAVLSTSLQLQPVQGEPFRSLVEAKQSELDGMPLLPRALRVAGDPKLDESGRMHLSYALGKLYEQVGDFESAIKWFDSANEIAYRTYPACRVFDVAWTKREPKLIANLYTKEFLARWRAIGSSDARPVFIVGMIRSGTTLLDQIVSSHSQVRSAGEGTFWNTTADAIHQRWTTEPPTVDEVTGLAEAYLHTIESTGNATRITDKMPLNYRNLGVISIAFPEARILHIRRDPFDTCLSIYTTFFGGGPSFAYRQEHIAAFYRAYLRYMEHWRRTLPGDRFLELDYETLVTDPEPVARKVIDFLGLPWDDACLRHDANSGQVSTPSRWQARQPVYTSSIGKRSHYEAFMGAIASL